MKKLIVVAISMTILTLFSIFNSAKYNIIVFQKCVLLVSINGGI